MNRLNRKIEYALMALKIIAQRRPHELTSAKDVVELTGSPFDATARVLQKMAQAGILRSEQGAYGGYVLARDLSHVSLYELSELILGRITAVKCLQGSRSCELKDRCNIHSPISILNRKQEEFYHNIMLGELLRAREPIVVERNREVTQ